MMVDLAFIILLKVMLVMIFKMQLSHYFLRNADLVGRVSTEINSF